MTNLEKLNSLLKDPKLGLPTFRNTVSASFGNLHWLKSKLPSNPKCSDELKRLLTLDPRTLLQPYETPYTLGDLVRAKIAQDTESLAQEQVGV